MPALAAAVAGFLAAEQVDRPHVAGCSLGGAIALELAAADLAASVTAFSPAGFASSIRSFDHSSANPVLRMPPG